MAEKDLKRMSRGELVEIIYQYQKRDQEQTKQISELKELLQDRSLKIENAGSIAEAALSVNLVFECAQAAADQYLEEARNIKERAEKQASQISEEAVGEAEKIRLQAQEECAKMRKTAKQECGVMYDKVMDLLKNYEEIRQILLAKEENSQE